MTQTTITEKPTSSSIVLRFARLTPNARGACWMVLGALGFAINGALIKYLAYDGLDPFQIAMARAFFALFILLPFIWKAGPKAFRTRHPGIHLLRGVIGSVAMMCGFYAVAHLPLADVAALGFTQPLFTILLAVILLKEPVAWQRWLATAIGFCGVLLMVRPGHHSFDPVMLVALLMAFGIGLSVVLVKMMPREESTTVLLTYFCIASLVTTSIPALIAWRDPTVLQWLVLAAIGVIGAGAQSFLLRAYKVGEATFVSPFDYSKIIIASALGFYIFGEIPTIWTGLGAAVIVGSTYHIARSESRAAAVKRSS
ncbi:DMT family transporter [Limibacillus halophilus]|uniref:Drug/metabolite transporter (DMT)-like permease n=1 Tax=Limibacillus halophilus TaxID=1579333 RepID=A0A839SU70_9PROT|nr:DMT family transporter [Limibacillus halophilus]MBB3065284.1 drug/metabolite transporter (DMT)-like permease [Limibacillus halophilus]